MNRTYEQCARLRDDCVKAGFLDVVRDCYALHIKGWQWKVFRPDEIVFLLMRDDALYARACACTNICAKVG